MVQFFIETLVLDKIEEIHIRIECVRFTAEFGPIQLAPP